MAGDSRDTPRAWQVTNDTPLQAHLHLPLGDIVPEAAIELGQAAREAGAQLRIGLEHDLLLFGPNPLALSPAFWAMSAGAPVVACPGSTWCTKGMVDSRGAAEQIGRRLPQQAD